MIEINDTTKGSRVKFGIGFEKKNQTLCFDIYPHAEVVYYSRDLKSTLHPGINIKLKLNINAVVVLSAALISNISIFFQGSNSKKEYIAKCENGFNIRIQKSFSKGKDKLILCVMKDSLEVIVLRITKSKAIFLLQSLKNAFEQMIKDNFRIKMKCDNGYVLDVGRNETGLLSIRATVLLQREMDTLRYLTDEMIYTFKPEKIFTHKLSHSQIGIFYLENKNMISVVFNKKNSSEKEVFVNITPTALAILYLANSEFSPNQKEIPDVIEKKVETITRFADTYIGFEKINNEVYSFSKKTGALSMHLCSVNKEGGLLSYLKINLQNNWNLILARLFELYNEEEYLYNEKGNHSSIWKFKTVQPDGNVKEIEVRVMSKRDDLQKASLLISSHFSGNKKDVSKIFISFTRNLLHSFLSSFLGVVSQIDGFEFSFKNDIDQKKRFSIKKKIYETPLVSSSKNNIFHLSASDTFLFRFSARNRLFHSRWLGFQGEYISMSNDAYLTDMKREYRLKNKKEDLSLKIALAAYVSGIKGELDA